MNYRTFILMSVLIGAMLVAAALPAGVAASTATSRAKCNIKGQQSKLGPSYVTKLTVSKGVSCSTGKSVVRAYDSCRKKSGGAKGKCKKKVKGYSCSETRQSSKFQFSANATCKAGKKRVVFSYTQNT